MGDLTKWQLPPAADVPNRVPHLARRRDGASRRCMNRSGILRGTMVWVMPGWLDSKVDDSSSFQLQQVEYDRWVPAVGDG